MGMRNVGGREGRREGGRKEGWISENTSMFKFLRQKFIHRKHIARLNPSESIQGVPVVTQGSPWGHSPHPIFPPCGLRFSDTHVLYIMLEQGCCILKSDIAFREMSLETWQRCAGVFCLGQSY